MDSALIRAVKKETAKRAESILKRWTELLPSRRRSNRGDIAGGLVLLERLKTDFDLDIRKHRTPDGYQLKGATAVKAGEILSRHGESRPLAKEGGRTNRGLLSNLEILLDILREEGVDKLPGKARSELLDAMQAGLTRQASELLNAKKLPFRHPGGTTTRAVLRRILDEANARGKEGEVMQHLIGAKLALRFPHLDIENRPASAADESAGRPGDFLVGDMVFHATTQPNRGHYEKCRENLDANFRVCLLVSNGHLLQARQIAESEFGDRVAVESCESFVSQNLEELSEFRGDKIRGDFLRLLEAYNRRVREVESDLSLLVDIPDSGK